MYINYPSLINTKYYDITHISMIAAQKIQNIHACTIDSILKKIHSHQNFIKLKSTCIHSQFPKQKFLSLDSHKTPHKR